MHPYETLFVLHPELPEAQVRETVERARRLIEGMQGQIAEVQDWGMRDLAYPVGKQARGIYVLMQYAAPPGVVKELERTLKIADEVLRFISVRRPAPTKATRRAAARTRTTPPAEQGAVPAPEQGS